MIDKIIITEGIDRSGKGTSLSKLEKIYTDLGYSVINIFKRSEINDEHNKLLLDAYRPLKTSKKKLSNHLNYDVLSLGAMEMLTIFLASLKLNDKKHIVLIDRYGLSNLVYSKILRKEEFNKTFENQQQHIENYVYSCIESLTHFSDVYLFLATKDKSAIYEDDNENENLSISKEQLKLINAEYLSLSSIFYALQHNVTQLKFHHKVIKTTDSNELFAFMHTVLFPFCL